MRAGMAGQGGLQAAAAGQVGAGIAGLGRGQEDGEQGQAQTGRQMHGAGIVGDQHGHLAQDGAQLEDIGLSHHVHEGGAGQAGVFVGQGAFRGLAQQDGADALFLPDALAQLHEVTHRPLTAFFAGAQLHADEAVPDHRRVGQQAASRLAGLGAQFAEQAGAGLGEQLAGKAAQQGSAGHAEHVGQVEGRVALAQLGGMEEGGPEAVHARTPLVVQSEAQHGLGRGGQGGGQQTGGHAGRQVDDVVGLHGGAQVFGPRLQFVAGGVGLFGADQVIGHGEQGAGELQQALGVRVFFQTKQRGAAPGLVQVVQQGLAEQQIPEAVQIDDKSIQTHDSFLAEGEDSRGAGHADGGSFLAELGADVQTGTEIGKGSAGKAAARQGTGEAAVSRHAVHPRRPSGTHGSSVAGRTQKMAPPLRKVPGRTKVSAAGQRRRRMQVPVRDAVRPAAVPGPVPGGPC